MNTGSTEWGLNLSGHQYETNDECKIHAPKSSHEHKDTSYRIWNGDLHSSLHGIEKNPGTLQLNKPINWVFRRGRSDKFLQQRTVKAGIHNSCGLGTLVQPLEDLFGPGNVVKVAKAGINNREYAPGGRVGEIGVVGVGVLIGWFLQWAPVHPCARGKAGGKAALNTTDHQTVETNIYIYPYDHQHRGNPLRMVELTNLTKAASIPDSGLWKSL